MSGNGVNGVNGVASGTTSATHMPMRSVSDHTLRSMALLEESSDSSDSSRPLVNGKCLPVVKNGHRLPSYVGISCAISGYSDYNRYCSSLRNSCTRRDISVNPKNSTPEPVNRLNESLNRKNSLISEALITSRHNVNDEDIRTNGTEESLELTNNEINSNLKTNDWNNKNNSLLEQRIASLYGQTFAKDWRESRTKSRHKLNTDSIFHKQRSPSCPPARKPTPALTPRPAQLPTHPIPETMKIDNTIDTQLNIEIPELKADRKLTPDQTVDQLESQNSESMEDNSQMKTKCDEKDILSSESISTNGNSLETCGQSKASDGRDGRDGNWFLIELKKTSEGIQEKIDLTEQMLQNEDNLMSDEISGKLRAAVGKANLLINQKFKQFEELCLKNISQTDSEPFITTNDDLEGFWDMVSIQVLDINDTFVEINKLCASGWKRDLELESPKKTTLTPTKPRSRKSTPKGSPVKSSDESATDRESERRNRLREAKRKARLKATQNDDEITIFIPNSK